MLQSKQSLERHRFFPYIAWFLVVGFSLFVYTIVQDLRIIASDLQETSTRLEISVKKPEIIGNSSE